MVDFLILVKDFGKETGVSVSIQHLCRLMKENRITYRVIHYKNDNELIEAARKIDALVLMLQVPSFSDETLERILKIGRETTLVIHSTVAFMQAEEGVLSRVFGILSTKRERFSVCNPSMPEVTGFRAYLPGTVYYLPNTYTASDIIVSGDERQELAHERFNSARKKISLFCEYRPFKNMTTQVTALALASEHLDIELHLIWPEKKIQAHDYVQQADSHVPIYIQQMLCQMRFPVIMHQSCGNYQMRQNVKKMAIGMQVSYTETFSYVVFEHMIQGIPTICSAAIPYATAIPNFSDPVAIAESVRSILHDEQKYIAVSENAYRIALQVKEENSSEALRTLNELMRRALA